MVSTKILFSRFLFVLTSELFKVAAITLAIVHLPFRLFKKRLVSSSHTAHPLVHVTSHDPAPSFSQPRDTVVLIHGFPDSSSLWDSTVSRLTNEGYRCITVDLPGSKGQSVPYAFDPTNTVTMISNALEPLCDTPFTLVGHDWGAMYSLMLRKRHPHLIHRLILVDVGKMSSHSDIHWTVWFSILSYQSTLALMFFIGEPCKRLFRYFVSNVFKYHARPSEEITVDMCYPYGGVFLAIAKHVLRRRTETAPQRTGTSVPILFVYGQRKLFNFHDSAFVEQVRSSPCGEVVALQCGHWIMLDLREEWLQVLMQWLQKSETTLFQEQRNDHTQPMTQESKG